jgi:Protein of unknown function (DUF4058)
MPIHDWTRVETDVFHGFHVRWISHITEALNSLLPPDYYADTEQYMDDRVADVLTLRVTPFDDTHDDTHDDTQSGGGTAIATRPQLAPLSRLSNRTPRTPHKQRHIVIRHVSNHRIVALIELVSPASKDRRLHREQFVAKGEHAIRRGVHLVVIDLFPPTVAVPHGLPAAVWRRFDRERVELPATTPYSIGSFEAADRPQAYFHFASLGQAVPTMPLFLTSQRYLMVPFADSYDDAFAGSPRYLHELLAPSANTTPTA